MSEIVHIDQTMKQYKDEWLLFEVLETDELDRPIRGRLLCHSKERSEIHKVAVQARVEDDFIVFTGDPVPPDMIVVL